MFEKKIVTLRHICLQWGLWDIKKAKINIINNNVEINVIG